MKYHRVLQTDTIGTGGYLEAALEKVLAGDNVRDFGLVQTMSDGRRSQSGIQGHDCEFQVQLSLTVVHYCGHECARI